MHGGSSHFHFVVVAAEGGVGEGEQGASDTNGLEEGHIRSHRDMEWSTESLAAGSKDTPGKFAGAGLEAFGVWMKKKSKQTVWQLISEDSAQPSSPKNLLRGVPKEARVPAGGRGTRTRHNNMSFLRQLIGPLLREVEGGHAGADATSEGFMRCDRRKEFPDVPALLKFRLQKPHGVLRGRTSSLA